MFIKYEEESEDANLSEFLEDVALISDIDSYNEDEDAVVLMTLHSAKGLNFLLYLFRVWRRVSSPEINQCSARRI